MIQGDEHGAIDLKTPTEFFGKYEPTEVDQKPLEFKSFPKISRLSRECVITEKIDGTNAQILITELGEVQAGSRTRWITPKQDNFGFASWVEKNKEELKKLGPGRFYGEWWGVGIQRGYGLFERRFSLFHTKGIRELPACCGVVPTLYEGSFDTRLIEACLEDLRVHGSYASTGFKNPEGIVIYHKASGTLFKKTLENDEQPKGVTNA